MKSEKDKINCFVGTLFIHLAFCNLQIILQSFSFVNEDRVNYFYEYFTRKREYFEMA
ncbi:MAG TPA: hypothetical protein PLB98_08665 [bacterium]|nr:hypothetical protein [bacterium]